MHDERASVLAELEVLRRRAAALERRVAALQRRRLAAPLCCLVLGVAIGALGLSWPDQQALAQPARDIVCSSLKIVGQDGKERLTLGYDQVSGFVKVHGPDGKIRAMLWSTADGRNGALNLVDENGKNRVILSGGPKGGGFEVYAPDGQQHCYVGSATNRDGGIVNVFGAQTKRAVELCNNEDGGYLWVYGTDGKIRSSLWATKGGKNGLLTLHNEAGKVPVWLGIDEHGGQLALRGHEERNQVLLDCHNQWGGGVFLYTPTGNNLMGMFGNSNNGNGQFTLYGADGQPRVEMFVDNTGVGSVQALNAVKQVIKSLK